MTTIDRRPEVAVIGGGFTGAAVAFHLAKATDGRVRIVVFEPRSRLGGGLAYDTSEAVHRVNVPAAKMSLLPDDDADFVRWMGETSALADDPEALAPDGWTYPRRGIFGSYVADRLAPLAAKGWVEHVRERVVAVERLGDGWRIATAGGAEWSAGFVVLAATHPGPALPEGLATLGDHASLIRDALAPGALDRVRSDDRILLVGLGLTAADVAGQLDRTGHRGPITALSRRGLTIRPHAAKTVTPFGDFATSPARAASDLVLRIRRTLRSADAEGVPWQAVIDAVRRDGGAIWRALPIDARRRVVRHLRPYWDAHRFRAAPQIVEIWERLRADGRLTVLAAKVQHVRLEGSEAMVALRLRGRPSPHEAVYDRIIVTTGPAHGGILAGQGLFRSLAMTGLLQPDPAGLGLACDESGRALGSNGVVPGLFVAGPLARGSYGELMGLPQVTIQAASVAASAARLALLEAV